MSAEILILHHCSPDPLGLGPRNSEYIEGVYNGFEPSHPSKGVSEDPLAPLRDTSCFAHHPLMLFCTYTYLCQIFLG